MKKNEESTREMEKRKIGITWEERGRKREIKNGK